MSTLPLFNKPKESPLADSLRPSSFEDVFGQQHLFYPGSTLYSILNGSSDNVKIPSLILWGSPGSGKTTLAKIIAKKSNYHYEYVSAVIQITADLRKMFSQAEDRANLGTKTLLIVDEIHRFNKSQQDLFLPYIEDGTIVLIGATTENPSFELNSALLSRCKVLRLNRLDNEALIQIIHRAENLENKKLPIDDKGKQILGDLADGDGRYLLNLCEELFGLQTDKILSPEELVKFLQKRVPIYDKSADEHYNLISALHKSMRGSDPDATLYWLTRMLNAGEDPLYILRRMVRFASEDIGLADPNALVQALAAKNAYELLGSPEGNLAITQAAIYLATSPKSNALYLANKEAMKSATAHGSLSPPKRILNSPTKTMKEHGYGEGYIYDHDTEHAFSGQDYFPENMNRKTYYKPSQRGFEREINKRLSYWENLRNLIKGKSK